MKTFALGLILGLGLLAVAIESRAAQESRGPAAPAAATQAQEMRGKERYDYWCAPCHAGDPREGGRYLPGTAALTNKYKGTRPGALEDRTDLPLNYIKLVIRRGSEGMPFFRKTEISDADMNDIAAYLVRNAKK